MRIGILALQGAFAEHKASLAKLGVPSFEIRQKEDLSVPFDGLIIPGGESTVQGKLMRELGLFEPTQEMIKNNMPVFGTCAGLLLLAKKIENDSREHLATMDITAVRNAYGRQLGSFYTEENFTTFENVPMTFIRAPYIESVGKNVEILSKCNGKIVAAREGNQLVTAFHPELTDNLTVHKYFLDITEKHIKLNAKCTQ